MYCKRSVWQCFVFLFWPIFAFITLVPVSLQLHFPLRGGTRNQATMNESEPFSLWKSHSNPKWTWNIFGHIPSGCASMCRRWWEEWSIPVYSQSMYFMTQPARMESNNCFCSCKGFLWDISRVYLHIRHRHIRSLITVSSGSDSLITPRTEESRLVFHVGRLPCWWMLLWWVLKSGFVLLRNATGFILVT